MGATKIQKFAYRTLVQREKVGRFLDRLGHIINFDLGVPYATGLTRNKLTLSCSKNNGEIEDSALALRYTPRARAEAALTRYHEVNQVFTRVNEAMLQTRRNASRLQSELSKLLIDFIREGESAKLSLEQITEIAEMPFERDLNVHHLPLLAQGVRAVAKAGLSPDQITQLFIRFGCRSREDTINFKETIQAVTKYNFSPEQNFALLFKLMEKPAFSWMYFRKSLAATLDSPLSAQQTFELFYAILQKEDVAVVSAFLALPKVISSAAERGVSPETIVDLSKKAIKANPVAFAVLPQAFSTVPARYTTEMLSELFGAILEKRPGEAHLILTCLDAAFLNLKIASLSHGVILSLKQQHEFILEVIDVCKRDAASAFNAIGAAFEHGMSPKQTLYIFRKISELAGADSDMAFQAFTHLFSYLWFPSGHVRNEAIHLFFEMLSSLPRIQLIRNRGSLEAIALRRRLEDFKMGSRSIVDSYDLLIRPITERRFVLSILGGQYAGQIYKKIAEDCGEEYFYAHFSLYVKTIREQEEKSGSLLEILEATSNGDIPLRLDLANISDIKVSGKSNPFIA